jgi:hypothetical protein
LLFAWSAWSANLLLPLRNTDHWRRPAILLAVSRTHNTSYDCSDDDGDEDSTDDNQALGGAVEWGLAGLEGCLCL